MDRKTKLINADSLLSSLRDDETIDGAHFKRVKQHINAAPAVDAVSRGVFEQVMWERDIAIGQLESYGVSLGEKADVVKVVHGRWEKTEYNGFVRCSVCKDVYINEEWLTDGKWNGCPNCFAHLDGERNDCK